MARSWPVQPREGFTGIPNAILARAIGELTPEQLRLFLGLVYSAEWRTEGSVSPDGRWRIERGQVLVSHDGLAKKYGMEVDAVRRALRRFEGVVGATRRAAQPATGAATSPATPPSLVDFGSWFGIPASADEAATPPATPGTTPTATSPTTIQQENTGTTNTEKPSPPPSAPARTAARRKRLGGEPDPRHRPLQQRLEAAFLELRGSAYGFQPRDARALAELLRLSGGDLDETERRWRMGLEDVGFRRTDAIHELATKWNSYSAASGDRRRMGVVGTERNFAEAPWAPRRNAHIGVAAPFPPSAFVGGEVSLTTGLPVASELDSAWLEALPASERPRAIAEWAQMRERVSYAAYPDARKRLVQQAREHFQEQYSSLAFERATGGVP